MQTAIISENIPNYQNKETNQIKSFNLSRAMYFSKLFSKIELTQSAQNVLNSIVHHWNADKKYAFLKQSTIAEEIGTKRRATVSEALKQLELNDLIKSVFETGETKKYYLTERFFELTKIEQPCTNNVHDMYEKRTTPCTDSVHHEHKHFEHNNKTSSCDDDMPLNQNKLTSDDKTTKEDETFKNELVDKLKSWKFLGSEFYIKKIGIEKMKKICDLVESKNPNAKGAYLRKLLELPYDSLVFPISKEKEPLYADEKAIKNKLSDLSNIEYAKVLISNCESINNKWSDNDLKYIAEIKNYWGDKIDDLGVINKVENKRKLDIIFNAKYTEIENEVIQAFNPFRKQIDKHVNDVLSLLS